MARTHDLRGRLTAKRARARHSVVVFVSVVAIAVVAQSVCAEDRVGERASELSLPDPYLDPSWPDERGEEMDGRYGAGRSDSVDDTPLDEEVEMLEEQRALEEVLGTAPGLPAEPIEPSAALPDLVPPIADDESPGQVVAPTPSPTIGEGPSDIGDGFEKDPMEW